MFRILMALSFLVAVFAVPDPASAQRGTWERLASKKVNMLADRDVIEMSRSDGRFNALRFEATRGSINIYRIRVTFGNGERQDLEINQTIRQGERTTAIDLDGRNRVIDRIEMLYASSKLFSRASLDIFGRRVGGKIRDPEVASDTRREREVVRNLDDWKKLGQRFVDLDFDRDRIWVGLDEGRFDQILLRARGGDIRLIDLKVVYGNGQVDDIRVRSRLRDGRQTRGIPLKGRHRGIRRIELAYEKGSARRRPVLLEVYARPSRPGLDKPVADPVGEEVGSWQVLGSREVDLSLDRDVVTVSRGEGPFDAIALRARGETVTIYDIRVTFGNGKRQTFKIEKLLRRGTQSPPVDLKGNARKITKVELLYEKSRKNRRRAVIEVLGRKVDRTGSTVAADVLPAGWSLLGGSEIDRREKTATIEPANRRRRVSSLMLRVKGAPVRIRTATVRFGNGESKSFRIPSRLRPGDQTDPIDLGSRRRIEAIDLAYDRPRGRRAATVEILSRR